MTGPPEPLNEDQQNRILQHGLHEETIFYNRLNFFSVFESILLATLVSLDSKEGQLSELTWILPILGILITVIWWYSQERKRRFIKALGLRAEEELTEFKATMESMSPRYWRWFSASSLMTHSIPAIFLILWIYLLARLLCIP